MGFPSGVDAVPPAARISLGILESVFDLDFLPPFVGGNDMDVSWKAVALLA